MLIYLICAQDWDAYIQDQTVFGKYMPESFDKDKESKILESVETTVTRAATTKLEYKLVKQMVEYTNPRDCKQKMTSAENSYSRQYRLRFQDHCHKGVLFVRTQIHKKVQAKKKKSDESDES